MRPPIHSLTGVRFFAAAWVLALHFREITVDRSWPYPVADEILGKGWLGVDLFFVLSGFILSYVYTQTFDRSVEGSDYRRFILFRIGRIYPVHLATFILMMALFGLQSSLAGGAAHPERFTPAMVVTSVTMTHAWVPGIISPNQPSWSISAEFFAYLLFPMLVVLITRLRAGPLVFVTAGIALAFTYEWLLPFDSALVRVMAGFLVGMGMFRFGEVQLPGPMRRWGALITLVLIGVWVGSAPIPHLAPGVLLFAALIVLLRDPRDLVGRFLALPLLVYGGEISYSLYMVHWPVRAILRTSFERVGLIDSLSPGLIAAAYWVASIVAAIVMYHVIEQPGRRLVRAIALRADGPRSATVSVPEASPVAEDATPAKPS